MNFLEIVQKIRSKKVCSVIMIGIMTSYGLASIPGIITQDTYPDYYMIEKPYLANCSLNKLPHLTYQVNSTIWDETARNPLKWYLDCVGHKAFFGYDNVLPAIFSIGIIGMTFILGSAFSGQRLVGLIASLALISNDLFYNWSNSVTYGQAWAFLLLLSIYLLYNARYFGPLAFMFSILSKALAVAYLPMYLYTIFKNREMVLEDKLIITVIVLLITLAIGAIEVSQGKLVGAPVGFHPENIIEGITRAVGIVIWEMPVLFGFVAIELMFRKYSHPIDGKMTCFVWMSGIWIISLLVYVFSGQFSFPYRFVPFAVFMSIYIGGVMTRVVYSFEMIAKKRIIRDKYSIP